MKLCTVGNPNKLLQEGGTIYIQMFVGNVTGDPLRTIAAFLGLSLANGSALSGAKPKVPFEIQMLERHLWAAFAKHCCPVSPELPSPVSSRSAKAVSATLYVWMTFLRIRGQSWKFLKEGILLWEILNAPRTAEDDTGTDDER